MTRTRNTTSIDWQEYQHFAGFGWTDERIAVRLGLRLGSLQVALARRERAAKVRNVRRGQVAA